ncbi:MAG TPA: hypothetical protein VIL08_00200 [Limnochorda sp.]
MGRWGWDSRRVGRVLAMLALVWAVLAPHGQAAELRLRVVEADPEATTAYVEAGTGRYVLAPPSGYVEAEYGQRWLRARRAEYDPEANRLLLAGEVHLEEPGLVIVAERVEADLAQESYTLEGRVRLERTPEEGHASRLTADQVTYRPATGEAWAQGRVRVEEGDRWFEAERARLWDGLGHAELAGNVTGQWGTGAVEAAERVTVVLETGHVTLFGPAELLFQVGDEGASPDGAR